ncbi:hypothetical protein EDC18_10232 [Natranaerovirga pectinivora]|uniref:Protein kinase domain-containing protein n=1 Tax=Natranaerovirga pectinivora TaxID=682400 RepID=A0A4R3MRJ0_9FIRM|nr:hypothetical protein [Natranaerovirga pectinivora]TCT16018.1 hypothetical protein EDC18_10232 [Natranaerovirga pectinivora]
MEKNCLASEKSYEIDAFKGEVLRLLDHNINDIFAEIIRSTKDFNRIKQVMIKLKVDDYRNDFKIVGDTSEELLKANSVDKKLNYVQFAKINEANGILKKWLVNVDIHKEILLLREIRNRLSHYDEGNKYKNIGEVHKDLFILECFVFNFKMKFPEKYEDFKLKYDEIIQKAKDFADKYSESTIISLKSNKISIEEYCKELQNDIFYGESIETIKEKLFVAIGHLGIDVSGGKFKKDTRIDIIKYIYKNKTYERNAINTENTEQNNDETVKFKDNSEKIKSMKMESFFCKNLGEAELRRIVRDFNILVDYRCLASKSARVFLQKSLIPILRSYGDEAKLFYVYETLNDYFTLNRDNHDKDAIIQFIYSNMELKVYSYIKTEDNSARDDDNILNILNNLHNDKNFCVITDKQNLISGMQKAHRDGIYIINPGLVGGVKHKPQKEEFTPLFKLSKSCVVDSNTLLKVTHIPASGDEVYTLRQNNVIKLVDFINGGGEGNIYTTSQPGIIAKVYFEKCITTQRKDKLTLMTEHQPNIKNVCWPIDIILNKSGEFVGYIMAQASGKDIAKTIFKGRCKEYNRSELVECLINIFKTISELHKNNILLGDINGGNILIQNPQEIYFVDTDSYQIEKYPCPVGTELFTPPEIFKSENGEVRDFSKFLRCPEDERYALGVLAFMILIPGATPYPMIEGKLQSGFRFPQTGKKAEGKLAYNCIWSYIHFQVKQLFWRVFDENDRTVTSDNWVRALQSYKRDIGKDDIKNQIFITTYKDINGDTFVVDKKCPKCNMPLNIKVDDYTRKASLGKTVYCRACTLRNIHINNLTTFMECEKCRRKLCVSKRDYDRQIDSITNIACERCGITVRGYSSEYEKRKSRGWSILCYECDSNKGLYDIKVCCSECDDRNGVRIKYAVPSLTDIINSIK